MDFNEFFTRTKKAINDKRKDMILLGHKTKFFRATLLLNLIRNLSHYLNFFDFKNDIVFKQNIPFIVIEGLKFRLDHTFYLKKSGEPQQAEITNAISFLRKNNIAPDIFIDLGSCWGEYSLFMAKYFNQCKIYCIEGSKKNYQLLKSNLDINDKISKLIKSFNIIISNRNGEGKIVDEVSTMNIVLDTNNQLYGNYSTVVSKTLSYFCKENCIENIDFMKIDIEGSELKLLEDLISLPIKLIQIELINSNPINDNLKFLDKLSKRYYLYDFKTHNIIKLQDMILNLEDHFKKQNTIDLFLLKKN